ncbi:MAG: MobF family relaxase [Verrucomicrobiota bacterium]|nr:MobF family relaxase [Verrucomicrobiota bacterium]
MKPVLTIKAQCNLGNAEKYFKEHLLVGDYYSIENQVLGEWMGKGAQQLGLSSSVKMDDFLKLCRNQNPSTGNLLTQRMKTTRWDDAKSVEVANRRVLYDFTFSPPKSVSVQALVGNDNRIVESHNRAVKMAMMELEHFAGTRVHAGLRTSERLTGNIVCALFRHDTSRALDPHLHTHCIVFNATHDGSEGRWKALSNFEMLRAQKFAENVYYHELARELRQFGYEIENKPRGDFEIRGISNEICSRFAKRHHQIDQRIEELVRDNPEVANGNVKKLRAQIAQAERPRKLVGLQLSVLKKLWEGQLSRDEQKALSGIWPRGKSHHYESSPIGVPEAVGWAEEHLFDRRSVLRERDLWSSALEHGRGHSFSASDLKNFTQKREYVRDEIRTDTLTTLEALRREWEIVCLARQGARTFAPFVSDYEAPQSLMADQRAAVKQILHSRDFITLFSGGAGTGKSHALSEVGKTLKASGHSISVIAPQRQQAIDLRKSFDQAQTVSEFLAKRSIQPGAVIIVDEAGQIGGKQMHDLLSLVKANSGRVILSGDTRQHGAVEASDALRAIERYSGLAPARLVKIRRQNPKLGETKHERKRIKQYRSAVRQAQGGDLAGSFDRLERLGAIVECKSRDEQRESLVSAYLDLAQRKQSTVVVSQTWGEIHEVNERIRIGLRSAGLIGKEDFKVSALERIDLTDAQKRDERFYEPGAVLVFNRNVAGLKKGDNAKLLKVMANHLLIESEDIIRKIAFKHVDKIAVCRPKEMELAKGDCLQLKANGHSADGKEVVNGELVTIEAIFGDGRIRLGDGRTLPSNFRQFVRGYAVTSYGSQGKTMDHVLFSDSMVKAATNNQQWLVSISRGRRGVKIFTQDKDQLRENVCRPGERELAIEMAKSDSSGTTPCVIRRYVENLIQSRRNSAIRTDEGVICKRKLDPNATMFHRHGMKI